MFLRIVKDSFARQPRRKILTAVALALGTAIATATLSVALDVGDRLAREFRSLGANLLVTPQEDTLPLEIGGVDYRPVSSGAYLPEADLGKLKIIFWRNNIVGFAPFLDLPVEWHIAGAQTGPASSDGHVTLIGTWYNHDVPVPNENTMFRTGVSATNSWWHVDGRWFADGAPECLVGEAMARRAGIVPGKTLELHAADRSVNLTVTGIISTGGPEDDAVVAPLDIAQKLSDRPGQYRRLLVSALTKPEDAFSHRDPAGMTPADYDRWYCTPYISSISKQTKEQFPGVDVRPIRQIAEGEGRILTRVSALMWFITVAALLAASLAVAATAGATVLERSEEVGLMKALGAPRRLVGAFFLGEQWLLALIGGAAGYALGLLLARIVGERVFGLLPEPRLILLPVVLGVAAAVATAGSILPLRRIVRLNPAPILRGQ